MATSAIPATSAPASLTPANPVEGIHYKAAEIQTRSSRIRSLAEVIGATADDAHSEEHEGARQRLLNNIINFADLIEEEVGEIIDMGEAIECLSGDVEPRREAVR